MRIPKRSLISKLEPGVFLLFWLVGSLQAQQVIFEDNFDGGKADRWTTIDGEWQVEDAAFARVGREEQYAKAMAGDVNWTDYIVEVDVTLKEAVGANCAGLLVRADEEGSNGFRFWLRTDMPSQFSKWVDNKYEHIKIDIPVDIEVGTTYYLKAIVEGSKHLYFINDEPVVEYEDEEGFRESGRIGFITYAVYPHFDNVKVSSTTVTTV